MLLRKILRDIKHNFMQFLSVILMAYLALFVYAGVGSEWYSLQATANQYYEDYNLADFWLYGENFTDEDLNTLLEIDGVIGGNRRMQFTGTGSYSGDPEMIFNLVETIDVSTCMVTDGQPFDPGSNGVWVNKKFAEARNLHPGDTLTVETNEITIEREILGIMDNPEYVYASASFDSISNAKNIGIVFAGTGILPEGFPLVFNQMAATSNRADTVQLEDDIEEQMDEDYIFLSREAHRGYQQLVSEIKQNKAIADVFPFVFIAVALLTILTTMTRIVNNQRTQIGTLKSLGFRNAKITWHYISYGLISSAIGSILGLVTGPLLLTPLFSNMQLRMFSLPEVSFQILPHAIWMTLITISLCGLITYLSCRSILREIPAQALRPKAPRIARSIWLEKTRIWQSMGFDLQWNLRDALRNKIRSLMAVVGVIGCMAMLICGFGLINTLNHMNHWKYDVLSNYQNKILLQDNDAKYLSSYKGETIQESSVEIRNQEEKKVTNLTVLEEDSSLSLFSSTDAAMVELPQDGLSISYTLADNLGVAVGDTVEWHLYGDSKWITSEIKAVYWDPLFQGITLYQEYYQKQELTYVPTAYLTKEDVKQEDLEETVWNIEDLKDSIQDFMETLYSIIYIMVVAAILMAIAVLYNLGVLSFTEKEREFATLSVLGFRSKKLRNLLQTQNLILTLLGLLPGYALGYTLITMITNTLGDDYDIHPTITLTSILISIAITLITSIVVNVLFTRKMNQIDMVTALKSVD